VSEITWSNETRRLSDLIPWERNPRQITEEQAERLASRKLTEHEKQKLSVMLHKGAHGEWDWDALANWGLEEELLEWGFSEDELQFTLDPEPPEDPGAQVDKAEELREKWGVRSGQLWGMGRYTICPKCGKLHKLD